MKSRHDSIVASLNILDRSGINSKFCDLLPSISSCSSPKNSWPWPSGEKDKKRCNHVTSRLECFGLDPNQTSLTLNLHPNSSSRVKLPHNQTLSSNNQPRSVEPSQCSASTPSARRSEPPPTRLLSSVPSVLLRAATLRV